MEQAFNSTTSACTGVWKGDGPVLGPATLASFLGEVEEIQNDTSEALLYASKLAQRRLGMAASLFTALRVKHPPTAAHCLRVALGVSSWSLALELSGEQREMLEVAALLHDIGKLGVPDHVLVKPGRLCGEEVLLMERHSRIGREILSSCCDSDDLLDIAYYSTAWYDGSKHGFDRSRDQLPVGSRMIAIVDAFDSMTTDHVYRRAMSRERALGELFECAGTQFDREMVQAFGRLVTENRLQHQDLVTRRWLHEIHPGEADELWAFRAPHSGEPGREVEHAFQDRLLNAMHDGVIFLDHQLVVLLWNRAAERLTGISAASITGKQWVPALVQLCDERGHPFTGPECPVVEAMRSGIQAHRRLSVQGRANRRLAVDLHVAPVLLAGGQLRGAAVILHDASSQMSLEERVQDLHQRATRDPLTKVANRAEFDRYFPEFVSDHLKQGLPGSLIICDVDHFKRINDTHGHQAGDEALISFASHLQRHARSTDLVARYGGEEFVILCADCDNATATRRAEDVRRDLASTQQPALDHRCMTASFGVTEIQAGDTPETFLRRADRALLQAKDSGRNLVVQLGTGIGQNQQDAAPRGWFGWFRSTPGESLLERALVTVVPLPVAAEKLRGFVADHHAEIVSMENNQVTVKIDGPNMLMTRRSTDRAVPFLIEMSFHEKTPLGENRNGTEPTGTLVRVVIRPRKQRDRRQKDAVNRARQLLVSLKSYLMAVDYLDPDSPEPPEPGADNFLARAGQVLSDWLRD